MKYYMYISPTKIDMLYAQLGKAAATKPKKSYKLGVSGVGAEFKYSPSDPNQYEKLESVLRRLAEKKMIATVPSQDPVQQQLYYEDTGDWHNGLFAVSHFGMPGALTYVLMKQFGHNLILLIGSPKNIIGEITPSRGLQMPDTSGGVFAFLSLFSGRYLNGEDLSEEFESFHEMQTEDRTDSPLIERPPPRYAEEWWGFYGGRFGGEDRLKSDPSLYARCMVGFCDRDIKALPVTPIQTTFKVISLWHFERPNDEDASADTPFPDVNCFCLGTPMFTAIP